MRPALQVSSPPALRELRPIEGRISEQWAPIGAAPPTPSIELRPSSSTSSPPARPWPGSGQRVCPEDLPRGFAQRICPEDLIEFHPRCARKGPFPAPKGCTLGRGRCLRAAFFLGRDQHPSASSAPD